MTEEELYYTLALSQVEGVGSIIARRLIDYFGSAKDALSASNTDLVQVHNVGSTLLNKLAKKDIYHKAEVELKRIQEYGLTPIYYKNSDYPYLLNQCMDAPVLFFSSVSNHNWNNRKTISIIGTRYATSRGISFCKQLIADLKAYDPIIVSGLAYGIDVTAHQAALDNGLTTYAVLGNPLNTVYPEAHSSIARKIEQSGGALLSEFWISQKVERENFIQRNRIVAGISQATIVIESAIKGGSMSTITFANDYNRDVFAVPGRVGDVMSAGCNEIIRSNRAQLLTSATDIVEALNWDKLEKKQKVIQPQLFVDLSQDEERIYNFLLANNKDILDSIALGVEMPIYKVSSTLLNLELKGLVRPLPGKYFELIA
ncbi:MAG: DNA-processing protein DprA [Flavobacteriaceae bacterium]|jgi:DNA processing protein|nr:DNA-processing protein DprA [Flavobacteriaceae bacterium]